MRRLASAVGAAVVATVAVSSVQAATESQSVEVQMRRLSDRLAEQYKQKYPSEWRYQRLAVVPFDNASNEAARQQLGKILAAQVNTLLVRDHGFNVVERAQIAKVLEEQALGQTGVLTPEAANKVGQLLDAQALVVGDVGEASDKFLVNVRVVSTESASNLVADSIALDRMGLVALSSDAIVLRSKGEAAFRSLLVPGWGQLYNRDMVGAGLTWGLLAAAAVPGFVALKYHLDGQDKAQAYRSFNEETFEGELPPCNADDGALCTPPSKYVQKLRRDAEHAYGVRNDLLIAFGIALPAVWGLNVLYAYLTGVDGESLMSGNVAVVPQPDGGLAVGYTLTF
jgi:TolB-like protein